MLWIAADPVDRSCPASLSSHRLVTYPGSWTSCCICLVVLLASLAVSTALCARHRALAEMTESLNINGATGLIDMPSGDAQEDATFTFSDSVDRPDHARRRVSFQFTERLSASFRFQTWRDWDTI